MTEKQLQNYLKTNFSQESESVEWKAWTGNFNIDGKSKDDLGSYVSALANENGGFLIIGVENKTLEILGIKTKKLPADICLEILRKTYPEIKIEIEEKITSDTKKKIWIVKIPKHPVGQFVSFHKPYQRSNDSLIELTESRRQEILNETKPAYDWSAQVCEGATVEDLDEEAVTELREKLAIAKNNDEYKNLEIKNLLNRVNLLTEGKINNTCLLFLGKPEITDKFLFDKNKISWVYRDELNEIEERLNIDEIRKPFILLLPEIQRNIQRFNTYLKDLDLFREDIRQYDEKAVEEVLVNAIAHRDWEIPLWIEVVQTPTRLEIRNPGEFLANWDKVLKYNQKPPYKNSNLVAFLNHIKLMEREGDGLRKVYKAQVGKGLEVIKRTEVPDRVDIILTGKVKNIEFAKFVLARRGDLEVGDIRVLEKIARGENKLERDISIKSYHKIKDLVKLHGPSKRLKIKSSIKKVNSEQVIKSASMNTIEQHILDHARDKKDYKGNYLAFYNTEIYEKLNSNKNTIRAILSRLTKKGSLIKIKDGCYKFNNKFKTVTTHNNRKNSRKKQ